MVNKKKILTESQRLQLNKIYFSFEKGGFASAKNLFKAAQENNVKNITISLVKDYLASIPSYNTHKRILRKIPRRRLLTYAPFQLMAADIFFLPSFKSFAFLVVMDTFTR